MQFLTLLIINRSLKNLGLSMAASKSSWTPERVNMLISLWNKGYSASKVAEQLGGISRNAVIGKVYRLKVNGQTTNSDENNVTVSGNVNVDATSLRRGRSAKPNIAANDSDPVTNKGVSFLNLEHNSCRWPIGDPTHTDFHFCGVNRVSHGSYCAEHMKEAYQVENRRKTS